MVLDKTTYKNTYFEKKLNLPLDSTLNISLTGVIDKILTFNDGINSYYIVIDYKTGSMHNDMKKIVHGFDMQLIVYLYLINKTKFLGDSLPTGMYLQSVMSDILPHDPKKENIELQKDNLKLNGYTTDNPGRIKNIDREYDENSYIKGLKTKADGTFYAYSKVLSDEAIEELINKVDENIKKVINEIESANFTINPKELKGVNVSCDFCPFNEICYKTQENIIVLSEGDDEDDTDDTE